MTLGPPNHPRAWVPTDSQLIEMRRLNRQGLTTGQIHAEINPPISIERFRLCLRRYGIAAQPPRKIAP